MGEITRAQVEEFARHCVVALEPEERAILRALISAWEREQQTCKWTRPTPNGFRYITGCDQSGVIWQAGDNFCFHCGRRIDTSAEESMP